MLDYELEFGLGDEQEFELDYESETDFEADYESEAFFRKLLPSVAPLAIRAIGRAMKESEFEGELESECELGSDFEFEMESEFELEDGYGNLDLMVEPSEDALMRQLARAAAHSKTEAEAEAFIGGLASLAAQGIPKMTKALASGSQYVNWNQVVPQAAQSVHKATPAMIKGTSRLVRAIRKHPKTRELVHTLPIIMKGTVRSTARRVADGKPVTARTTMHDLAQNTARVLRDPRKAAMAMRWASPRRTRRLPAYR